MVIRDVKDISLAQKILFYIMFLIAVCLYFGHTWQCSGLNSNSAQASLLVGLRSPYRVLWIEQCSVSFLTGLSLQHPQQCLCTNIWLSLKVDAQFQLIVITLLKVVHSSAVLGL